MNRSIYIVLTALAIVLAVAGCSTKKNTAKSRWWQSFNTRYNVYFNASQAFIDGNLEKEKGNKDNYTEMIPLYMVGNKQSREIGKGQYDRAIEKCEKAIRLHSIKAKPVWDKSRRKTAKDREWLGRKEYNPFIWKAWLLLGKAQFQAGAFDEAAATFSYMNRLYQTQPLMNGMARAWLAKCYTELGWRYDAEDVIRSMSRDSMDFRAVKDWDYTYANYYIREKEYEKAIPYLRKVIKHERRKIQRAREWFLMGQIQRLLGNRQEAYKAFGKVISCHPPYEMQFNARIAQTEVMARDNGRQMISKLKRMASSDNNKEYLDQVYYAIGNIHLIQRDTLEAIAAYEKGNKASVRNGIEKGVLLLTLGNIYWEKEKFADAKRCYGEAIGLLDKERPDYEELSLRSKILDELVPHTEAIHLQDSLLALSEMTEEDRNEAIDRVIDALKQKEKEEREAMLDSEAEKRQQEQQQNSGFGDNSITQRQPTAPRATPTGNGQWYFYNPTAVSQGKITFQQQWGKRTNADNWRRSNQTVVNLNPSETTDSLDTQDTPEVADSLASDGKVKEGTGVGEAAGGGKEAGMAETGETGKTEAEKGEGEEKGKEKGEGENAEPSPEKDPHKREYYMAQIPFTDEQKTACHNLIKDGLFHAGIILKDKVENLILSEKYLRRLTDNYQDYEHLDEAWYHLYLLYARKGNKEMADYCISQLKAKHAESEWTTLLSDPHYAENAKFGEHLEDSLYTATYEAFKNDRSDLVKANAEVSESRFPLGEHRSKFIFIEGLSLLNEGDGDGCMEKLKVVVEKYPESEVSALAGMIIKGVQEGRRLHGGKFDIGDVWTRRDITLKKDSTAADTLSAERNQQFLFMLVYEPDSINENQLLFEMARHNFTNFLVRNFEIKIDQDHEFHRMIISGFLSYDESMQYARQLYENEKLTEILKPCKSLVISEANLALIGKQFSYEDYMLFYEDTFVPMKISTEKLLIIPEDIEQPDIEEIGTPQENEQEEKDEEDELLPEREQATPKVQDFDFGEDFW